MRKKTINLLAAATLCCSAMFMLSSCTSTDDNPVPQTPTEESTDVPAQEIDPNDFQPTDISVALLGSLSSQADDDVVRYWFTNLTTQVTDETAVVITDEITDANEEAIAQVLENYGVLLVVSPKEDNVKKYAKALGIEASADYSKLELIGVTGFGDQFLSYDDAEDSAEDTAPAALQADAIWDIAPGEYLRLKAFARWAEQVEAKYTAYLKQLEDEAKAIEEAIEADEAADEVAGSRALTRSGSGNIDDVIKLASLPTIDKAICVQDKQHYTSYHNADRKDDKEWCHFSATCNYQMIPMYMFPKGTAFPGADYYIVEASMNWDCTETCLGYEKYDHGPLSTARDSYRFFPLSCTLYSTPVLTSPDYEVVVPADGSLWPEKMNHDTSITKERGFNVDGNVAAGGSGGVDATGPSAEGHLDASLGFGAQYNKTEEYSVKSLNVDPYVGTNGAVGHTFMVPEGEDGYAPVKESGHTPTIYVPKGVNYRTTFTVHESWVWKINNTKVDTYDPAFKLKLTVKPKVAWYSYFFAVEKLDQKVYEDVVMEKTIDIPAPVRMNVGFIKVEINSKDADGKGLNVYAVKATDVTDKNNKHVVYFKEGMYVKYGQTLNLGLPAGKRYDIELIMGSKRKNRKAYTLDDWYLEGSLTTVELPTEGNFED